MLFSEPVFLFIFLPLTLITYSLSGKVARNAVLLLGSLFFYAWGEELYVLILIFSILLNYLFGVWIAGQTRKTRLLMLWLGVLGNLALLGYFKYSGFLLGSFGLAEAAAAAPALPIGISFFTFQALSYLIDLYFGRVKVQRNPFRLALYISMFPQLIAGPIVRYAEVDAALTDRTTQQSDIAYGVNRFVIGLAKKTLLADPLGLVADQIFGVPQGGLTPALAWTGAICYSLQLYFDFSAYSDMAIGLGRLFGFRFPENFNYPYAARSITDFWRRWHMTLSRWFRDYLYIPLGGSRRGAARTYLNLWIVFLATGLWHGAAWSFVFWGAYHGAFLILERLGLGRALSALPRVFQHFYLLLVVVLGWIPFRAETFAQTFDFYGAMLLWQSGSLSQFHPLVRYVDGYVIGLAILGALLAVPLLSGPVNQWVSTLPMRQRSALVAVGFWALFCFTIVSVGSASYSPFIYFRF